MKGVEDEAAGVRDGAAGLHRACVHRVPGARNGREYERHPGEQPRDRHGARAKAEIHFDIERLEREAGWRGRLEGDRLRHRDRHHRDDHRDDGAVAHGDLDTPCRDSAREPLRGDVLDGVERHRALEVAKPNLACAAAVTQAARVGATDEVRDRVAGLRRRVGGR